MFNGESSSSNAAGSVDPYALFEALTGRKINRDDLSEASSKTEDYDDLRDFDNRDNNRGHMGEIQPDRPPKDNEVMIGAINPYAMVEAMLGHKLDRRSMNVARILSDVLQTDYDELFDLKHRSVLFAGLKLNEKERRAEELKESDIKILREHDLVTPDLSRVMKLGDLEKIGLQKLDETRIKEARIQNGKLRVVLQAEQIARTVSNRELTQSMSELATRFRKEKEQRQWTPPNGAWRDIDEVVFQHAPQRLVADVNRFRLGYHNSMFEANGDCNHVGRFDDPVQGATSNSWLIAAIFSVFWADPSQIQRASRKMPRRHEGNHNNDRNMHDEDLNSGHKLQIKFHNKGGRNNADTRVVEVDYEVPINKSSNDPIYCRASGENDIWPALYEKAFAKWITRTNSERPDITQTQHGDPIKAMAQINGREPHYFFTERHQAHEILGVVRHNSVNFKTICPMTAFTHASGYMYRGSNLVANHAYSVLGWTNHGERQYVILRNPWGVTEPMGLTAYPGLIDRVEPAFWRPACLLDHEGVLAVEAHAFREYFACIGVAK